MTPFGRIRITSGQPFVELSRSLVYLPAISAAGSHHEKWTQEALSPAWSRDMV